MAIVIPAYKGRFLKETLDSIAVQAHKDEFVLYIGDDASPERLDKIVESYQNKVNLVYHRFSENMGGKDLCLLHNLPQGRIFFRTVSIKLLKLSFVGYSDKKNLSEKFWSS